MSNEYDKGYYSSGPQSAWWVVLGIAVRIGFFAVLVFGGLYLLERRA